MFEDDLANQEDVESEPELLKFELINRVPEIRLSRSDSDQEGHLDIMEN